MKKMIKILSSVISLFGALTLSSLTVSAETVTTVPDTTLVSSEKIILDSTLPDTAKVTDISVPEDMFDITDVTGSIELEELKAPKGNGILVEDVNAQNVNRQFLTIQSKNGNTFYIIVDKDSEGLENVYFMNLVDEYDLMAFADKFPDEAEDEKNEKKNDSFGNITKKTSDKTKDEADDGDDSEPGDNEKPSVNKKGNMIIPVIAILVLVGGAMLYFLTEKKKSKSKKKFDYDDDEFDDEDEVDED